jgi:hypothetical protein|tara:strand:- start:143 stop:322 length:180 start_codon:yes stop_codon:yes gene_type:complete
MKHYKVIKKDTQEEVWKGIADSKWEALERGYSKQYFINPKIKRTNLIVKALINNNLNKF